ncbi:AfsR/SARP family transcriptional regulator [Streptomyces sp. NPDC091272]|uniref:AfsR/SARP family transcriptional regulator n=1 Tax=Streptomyces sp. NPDC091272 TaxID=3365981 RepID=UPI00382A1789
MRYQILGTARALHDDGTPVPLGGPRLRATLTALALRPGRRVPVRVLVDDLWGDADTQPADAPAAVQALIARLRRSIGREAVVSVDGGYLLAADPDDVDLFRFERLATEGSRALAEGDPTKAVALLDDAISLWQSGPALADLPGRTADAARWAARRLDARRARLASWLALGRAEEALAELAALCAAHPIDEPLQALRLRALHEAGRTAEALEAYEAVRRDLADRLGVDPSAELRSLHGQLLDSPETAGSTVAPMAAPTTGAAAGAAGTASAGASRLSSSDEPRTSVAPGGNLRSRLTSFVGREADIVTIRGDLAQARLVTLLGPGGAGKTRLSQEVAEAVEAAGADGPAGHARPGADAAPPWPDGVWMVELAPVDDPEAVPDAVLTALGARETVLRGAGAEGIRVAERLDDDPLVRLAEHCGRRRMLLLLDNCEHLVDAAAHLAEHLLAHCPGLTVLATSREPLGVPGELVRPVDPLPEPVALRLFAERGAAARPGFRVEDDPSAAAEICRRLDGLPLAIELAAARLRMLTPRQIADRLDDRFRLLSAGARTVLPRQQTLRAVVDWSWDLLTDGERAVLRTLAVFSGGCDLAAAEAVCGPDALDLLGSLVDKSLVVAEPSEADGGMRYRLLETVSEYAVERLAEAGGREAAEQRHLVHFRELARVGDRLLRSNEQLHWIARFRREYENLRSALRRAVAVGAEQEALCLVHSLAWYWQVRDLRTESRYWTAATMALGPDPFAGPAEPAAAVFEQCTDAPPPMRPEVLQEARRGVRLLNLVNMNHDEDIWLGPERKDWLGRVVATYRPGLPQACRTPGALWIFALLMTSEHDELLREAINQTVEACRGFGYEWELAFSLEMRANIFANRTAWAGDARRDADESLEIFLRHGDSWGAAEALAARGEAHERVGEFAAAAEAYREAIRHAQRLEARSQVLLLRSRLAGALIESGAGDEGETLLRGVLKDPEGASIEVRPFALLFLAVWLARSGRVAEARAQLTRMRIDFDNGNLRIFDGFSVGLLAWVANLEEAYEEGLGYGAQALERSQDSLSQMVAPQMLAVHLMTVAGSLAGLATFETGAGRRERLATEAAMLLGAYAAGLPEGHWVAAQEADGRDLATRLARTVLDDAAYDAAYTEGGGLSMEEATALVYARRDEYRKNGEYRKEDVHLKEGVSRQEEG